MSISRRFGTRCVRHSGGKGDGKTGKTEGPSESRSGKWFGADRDKIEIVGDIVSRRTRSGRPRTILMRC